jgi:hypothetical protein
LRAPRGQPPGGAGEDPSPSVGLPEGYRGAAGALLTALGVDLEELREAVSAELREPVS